MTPAVSLSLMFSMLFSIFRNHPSMLSSVVASSLAYSFLDTYSLFHISDERP